MYVGLCEKKLTDVTPFVILNIFISNSLIKYFVSVTVTD